MKFTITAFSLALLLINGCAAQKEQSLLNPVNTGVSARATEYYDKAFELIKQSNDKEAILWVEKAATLDHAQAQFLFGYMIDTGKAGYTQPQRAIHWYSKAAKQGNMDAQFNLGTISENSKRIPEHYLKAVERKQAEEASKAAQINTIFVGKISGYVDLPLIQPTSCFEPLTICTYNYVTYKIDVTEVLAGEALSGTIHATRLQHGQYYYSGNTLSAFVVTKIENKNNAELLKADYELREYEPPVTKYCFSERLDAYIPELQEAVYSNCMNTSSFIGNIKGDFIETAIENVESQLKSEQLLLHYDEGYIVDNAFISYDADDEKEDNCPIYWDRDKRANDPKCAYSEVSFEAVRFSVKKGYAEYVKKMIDQELRKTKVVLDTVKMNFKLTEHKEISIVEWQYISKD